MIVSGILPPFGDLFPGVGYPGFGGGNLLPTSGLLAKIMAPDMVDTIGESTITFVSGDASDLMNATFSFDSSAVTLQLDTLEGGDVLFDSANAMAPIVRLGYDWYELLNTSYMWIGPRGIAGYSTDQILTAAKIQRYLGYAGDFYRLFIGTDTPILNNSNIYIG